MRPEYKQPASVVDQAHPALVVVEERLRAQADTQPFWSEGWSLGVVELREVCSLQQGVASQHAADRVADIDPDDVVSIADVTLPSSKVEALPIQFDQLRNAWIISAPNANLKIMGGFQAEVQAGVTGVGFGIAIAASFLQVALHHGRYVLRDGYHRAFGLLSRGVTYAPAFIRDFGVGELGVGQGLFSTAVYLGPRPRASLTSLTMLWLLTSRSQSCRKCW